MTTLANSGPRWLFDVGLDDFSPYDRDNLKGLVFTSIKDLVRSTAGFSEIASVGLNLYRYSLTRHQDQYLAGVDVSRLPYRKVSPAYRDTAKTKHESFLPHYKRRVEALVRAARDNQIEPILMTQPTLYGFGQDPSTKVDLGRIEISDETNGEAEWEALEMYNEITRQVAHDEGVLLIELAWKMPKDSKFYYDFFHFANQGAEEVAEIIYTSLKPFLSAKFSTFVKSESRN